MSAALGEQDRENMWSLKAVVHVYFSISYSTFHRPHPKDGEGTVFTGVCLSVSIPPSLSHKTSTGPHVLSWGGGTPVPGGGTLVPGRGTHGIPMAQTGWGTSSQNRTGYPQPGQDRSAAPNPTPLPVRTEIFLARTGWVPPWPGLDGVTTPLPHTKQRKEYLLRGGRYGSLHSRRRTVLLWIYFWIVY